MATLNDLLLDSSAQIELVIKGTCLDEAGISHTEWISQSGWDDQIGGPFGSHIPPLLMTSLRINQQVDPLEPLSSLNTFGNIELSNNNIDYAGRYDSWWQYSVDGQSWIVYAVGILSTGIRVELADVENTPLFDLKGINIPEVGSDQCLIRCKSARSLDSALQPITYSPPCLSFPGTVAGAISLGNNINITGVQSLSAWIYLTDPATTTQYILFKDSGAAGYYLAVGLVGAGTIAAGVEIVVRGQTPATSTTAANVLRAFRWHRIDISIDTTSRRIDIDGVTALTTAGVTGTPTTTTTVLTIGKSLLGRISRVLWWSDARSNATMSAEGRIPIVGSETNLREAFLFGEGQGSQVASSKLGSVIVGTLGTGVLWDTASWHYESILGQYEPYVLGTVPRVPVTWIDPPKQIGQISHGPFALLAEVQSNHTIVSPANYTIGYNTGTLQIISGALSGTYSATVTANNLWNSAVLFNGTTSTGTATVSMPSGSKYLGAHFRADNTSTLARTIVQWVGNNGLQLRLNGTGALTGTNILRARISNDALTEFTASIAIQAGKRYSAIASFELSTLSLKLYVNGVLAATTTCTGAFTLTTTTFSVGHRSAGPDSYLTGIIDEIIVGNVPATLATAKAFHALPATSSFTGITAGWHLDEATGTTAAPFVGAASITFANITWTAGRSAAADLGRSILYSSGYVEADLDTDLWFDALNDNLADCGWFVSAGAKRIDVLNIILGGLGFITYKPFNVIKIRRFEGLSGVPEDSLDYELDLQSRPIDALAADPAIYSWTVIYSTNNSKQDAANISGGLAGTDPDRYQYGSMAYKSVPKSDGSVLDRFPSAETRTRTTALLSMIDAENEATRLLAIHRHGADRKSVGAFASVGSIDILTELGPLMPETDLDNGDVIVTGVEIEDGLATITIWRPSF